MYLICNAAQVACNYFLLKTVCLYDNRQSFLHLRNYSSNSKHVSWEIWKWKPGPEIPFYKPFGDNPTEGHNITCIALFFS